MSTQTHFSRPVKTAVYGFLGQLALIAAVAFVEKLDMIEAATAKRAIGLVIGLMVVTMGNILPKMRPLKAPGGDPGKASAAERFAGWTLVLMGLVYIALFLFAPLDQARSVASMIAIAAMVLIALSWAGQVGRALFGKRPTSEDLAEQSEYATKKRVLTVWLLFAFFTILVAACVKFLFGDQPWGRELGSYVLLAFTLIYAVIYGALGDKRSAK